MSSEKERAKAIEPTPAYFVPALEKGLDILECLASQGVPTTQSEIARLVRRTPSEIFRMLTTLERRGYIARDGLSGAYSLTLRLYELGHAHSPHAQLVRAASRPMRDLMEATRESCHLSVIHRDHLLVLAEEESPARVRVSVKVGSTTPVSQTASGRVILAYLEDGERAAVLGADSVFAKMPSREQRQFLGRLEEIRQRGYESATGETVPGVSDLSVLVGTADSQIQAALAIAALPRDHDTFIERTLPPLREAAHRISVLAGLTHDDTHDTSSESKAAS